MKKRSMWVRVVGVVIILNGIWHLWNAGNLVRDLKVWQSHDISYFAWLGLQGLVLEGLGIGFFMCREWVLRLMRIYLVIAVIWGILEMVPIWPSVPLMYLYSKQWAWFLYILAKGLILNGLLLWYIHRPGVKAQFVKRAINDK